MAREGGKMRRKQVQKWDEAREVDRDQPKDKQSQRPPKSSNEGCWKTRWSTKITQSLLVVHKSTEPRQQSTSDLSLSRRRSNKHQKGGWPCQQWVLPTSQKPTGKHSTNRHTEKSIENSTEKSTSQVLPTTQKPTGMQSTKTRTEKPTEKFTEK